MNQREIDALMEQCRQPAIMLHRPYPPGTYPETTSYLGGLPALPPGTEWPRTSKGVPLHFLSQIDCAELPPTDGVLPDKGVLFFFARVDDEMIWGYGDSQDDCRVIFAPAAGNSAVPAPDDLPTIEGGYAAYSRYLALPGEPSFAVYPRWPVVGLPISSWPDRPVIPNGQDVNLTDYQVSVERARTAEAVRVTGLPLNTGIEPHWGSEPGVHPANTRVRLPADDGKPFPQVWIMVDRIARYLGNSIQDDLQRERAKGSDEPPNFDIAQFEAIYNASMKWVEEAAANGLATAPGDEARPLFAEWISALANDEFARVRSRIEVAIRVGMSSAIQFAADSPEAAALIPPRYYNDLEGDHLPTRATKSGYLVSCEPWRIGPRYHQMLGKAGASQEPAPSGRDEVMLLQLISDYGVNFMFCDVGEAEFWIGKDDLAARRFDRVRATTAGG